MQTILRTFSTTFKQIKRSGWLGSASVMVMTLSFLVTIVFLSLAFTLNLVLKSIENEPHIYVFFKPSTSEEKIIELRDKWAETENIESVIYTSEKQALDEFKNYNEKTNPIAAEALREGVLPASLGIRLETIEFADNIITLMEKEKTENENVLTVGYSKDVIDNIRDIANIVRIVGAIIMSLLVVVILLFTLLTVEFRIFHRSEEIGIMQLVGGSLWYIRMPFILESAIYGLLGAALSVTILVASYYGILYYYSKSDLIIFVNRFFGDLSWPTLALQDYFLSVIALLAIGAFIGAFNSYVAIRRYIK